MIKILIASNGEKVIDSINTEESTLLENAVTLRRLEEIKQKLLNIEYESKSEYKEGDEE